MKHICPVHELFEGNNKVWDFCPECNRNSPVVIQTHKKMNTIWENTWLGAQWPAPNLTQGFHGVLKQWWEKYGFGDRCLLSSENIKTKNHFIKNYPGIEFVCTDKYEDPDYDSFVDFKFDICQDMRLKPYEHPEKIIDNFSSIVSHAQLEHVIDPITALRNFSFMLKSEGMLYLMTQGVNYQYHGHPRNYMHFFEDFFEDIQKEINMNIVDYVQIPQLSKECKIICVCMKKS